MKAEAMFDSLIDTIRRMTADNVDHIEEIAALESELDALTTERDELKAAIEIGHAAVKDAIAACERFTAERGKVYRLGYTNAVQHISAQLPESTFKVFEVIFEK